jgi:VanZ family protein
LAVIGAALALIALGGVLELVQGFVGRDMSLYDELANAAGVIMGAVSGWLLVKTLRGRLGYW